MTSLRRDQLLAGMAAILGAQAFGAAHAQVPRLPFGSTQQTNTAAPPTPPVQAGRQSLGPGGYSLRYIDVRSLMARGDFDGALALFQATPAAAAEGSAEVAAPTGAAADDGQARRPLFSSRDVFLSNSEMGLMHYECSRHTDALSAFESARGAAEEDAGSGVRGGITRAFRWARDRAQQAGGAIMGRGDFGPYRKRDYEGILQLNYLALNFLIQGDRRSYNVARASADEQVDLQARFAERVAEAQADLAQRQADPANAAKTNNAINTLTPEFAAFFPVANRVPNAYVNPFGPYASAVVLEIASLEQPSLRGNARAAYEEALAIAPTRTQLTQAAAAMNDNHTPGERIVHVMVAEGFAPSRNVLRYGLPLEDGTVMGLRMGMFVPEPSAVSRVDVNFTSGPANARRPVTLDPISDVEALVLRDQNDRLLFAWLDLIVAAYRDRQLDGIEQQLTQLTGRTVSLDSVPDLRSWCSLPRRMHVARLSVPAGVNEIALTTRSGAGGVLQTTRVALDPENQQTLIYARATDSTLRVDRSRRLWVDGVDLTSGG